MKLTTIKKQLDTIGADSRMATLTDGTRAILIKLEDIINGRARAVTREKEGAIMKAIRRNKWEYWGGYTVICVREV